MSGGRRTQLVVGIAQNVLFAVISAVLSTESRLRDVKLVSEQYLSCFVTSQT